MLSFLNEVKKLNAQIVICEILHFVQEWQHAWMILFYCAPPMRSALPDDGQ